MLLTWQDGGAADLVDVCSLRRHSMDAQEFGIWDGSPGSSTTVATMVVRTMQKLGLEVGTTSMKLAAVWDAPSTNILSSMRLDG